MAPVIFIEGKVIPCFKRSVFVHSRYDKSNVLQNGFLVNVQ